MPLQCYRTPNIAKGTVKPLFKIVLHPIQSNFEHCAVTKYPPGSVKQVGLESCYTPIRELVVKTFCIAVYVSLLSSVAQGGTSA